MVRTSVLLALAAAGCHPWSTRPCLSADVPGTAFVRREWRRAHDERAPLRDRVCALEGIVSVANGASWDPHGPACTQEVVARLTEEVFSSRPIRNDRLLLARLRALDAASSAGELIEDKARLALRLARIDDGDVTDYRLSEGEAGPPLDRRIARWLALQPLSNGHLAANRPEVRVAALARRQQARDVVERALLHPLALGRFSDALNGHPERADDQGQGDLFDALRDEAEAALDRPFDALEHGILLRTVRALGFYGRRLRREPSTDRLLRRILEDEARLACVRGHPAARRDLYVTASVAAAELVADHRATQPWVLLHLEEPPVSLDAYLAPSLDQRGFDCRGRGAESLVPARLERLDRGEIEADDALLELLPLASPGELASRPALLDALFERGRGLRRKGRVYNPDHYDPLRPFAIGLGVAPGRPGARAFVASALEEARTWHGPGMAREAMLAARHAARHGLEAEARRLADELAAKSAADPRDPAGRPGAASENGPSAESILAVAVRATLDAQTLEPW